MSSSTVTGPMLDVRELTVSVFSAGLPVTLVHAASFIISPGEIVGLVGASGSGKTVLCRSMTRLFPPGSGMRIEGEVCYNGRNILGLSGREMANVRRRIRYVFQEPMLALNPLLKLRTQLRFAAGDIPAPGARIEEMLDLAGIKDVEDVLECYPHQVSVGMAQRVCVAMALLPAPSLVIADEPTSALDASLRFGILDLFRQVQQRTGNALLLVTHDLEIARRYATRMLEVENGEVRSVSTPVTRPGLSFRQEIAGGTRQPLLSVRNLRCSVRQARAGRFMKRDRAVLQGVTLSIPPESSVALVGESGSGKTTLARCIVGLQVPESGEIVFQGMNIFPEVRNRETIGRTMQLLFQSNGMAFDPRMTIRESLAEAFQRNLPEGQDLREEELRIMEALQLPHDCLERYPRQLSGGQLQRAGLARALAAHPKLLVLDEPTSALDTVTAARLLELLRSLQAQENFSLFYITHDICTAVEFCDRLAVLEEGKIVEEGPGRNILDHPAHPVTARLLRDSRIGVS
jgi:peptide/nickel transport system ATP-binding protein